MYFFANTQYLRRAEVAISLSIFRNPALRNHFHDELDHIKSHRGRVEKATGANKDAMYQLQVKRLDDKTRQLRILDGPTLEELASLPPSTKHPKEVLFEGIDYFRKNVKEFS